MQSDKVEVQEAEAEAEADQDEEFQPVRFCSEFRQ